MNSTDGYTKYDRSKLIFNGETLSDLCKTYMDKGEGKDIRYNSSLAGNLGIKQHGWTDYILSSVETISKKAAEASQEGKFSLVCDMNQDFFDVFARTLYHQKGIKVKKVDNLSCPKSMLIKWGTDNNLLHPAHHFMQDCRKNTHFTDFDFTIKGLDRTFPCHRLVIGWKSSFVYKGLTSSISDMKKNNYYEFPEGTLPQTVEYLLSYLYDEKKDVSGLPLEVVIQLIDKAKFLELNQLKWFCVKELIKHLNIDNASTIANCLVYSKTLVKEFENYFINILFQGKYTSTDLERIALIAEKYGSPKFQALAILAGLSFADSEEINEILDQFTGEDRKFLEDYSKVKHAS